MTEQPNGDTEPKDAPDTTWMKETEVRKDYSGDERQREEK